MRPIFGLMIMGKHNQTIDNQCPVRHIINRGIEMEVLWGVVIARNFCDVKNGAAACNPPPPTTLFFAISSTRSAILLWTGRSWSLWGLCLWWLRSP